MLRELCTICNVEDGVYEVVAHRNFRKTRVQRHKLKRALQFKSVDHVNLLKVTINLFLRRLLLDYHIYDNSIKVFDITSEKSEEFVGEFLQFRQPIFLT